MNRIIPVRENSKITGIIIRSTIINATQCHVVLASVPSRKAYLTGIGRACVVYRDVKTPWEFIKAVKQYQKWLIKRVRPSSGR